jgi:hypothetical protein
MLTIFVSAASGDAWLCEIHDLKGVSFILNATLGSKIKPLLMAARVRVHLHEQVVCVFVQGVPLRLQQIARFEERIKIKNLIAVLRFEPFLPFIVAY